MGFSCSKAKYLTKKSTPIFRQFTEASSAKRNGKINNYWITTINLDGKVMEIITFNSTDELVKTQRSKYDNEGNEIEMTEGKKDIEFI